jgi:Zinc knuckle
MAIVGVSTKKFSLPPVRGGKDVSPSAQDHHVATAGSSKKRKKGEEMQPEYNVKVKNRFHALSDSGSDIEIDAEDPSETSTSPKTKRKELIPKTPPIVLYHFVDKHTKTFNELRSSLEKDFELKYKGDRVIIKPSCKPDYDKIIAALNTSGLEYHTYTPQEDKELRVVVKNIPPNVTTEEILQDLNSKGLKVIKVSQMYKKVKEGPNASAVPNSNNVFLYPMFIVSFDKNTTFTEVNVCKKVCHCVVKWEKFRNIAGVTQCFNCQSFGHIAANCKRQSKCVKCGGSHNTKECVKTISQPPKCSNCSKEHPASFRKCPVYARQLELKSAYLGTFNQSRVRQTDSSHRNTRVYNSSDYPPLSQRPNNNTSSPPAETTTWPRPDNTQAHNESPPAATSFAAIVSELRQLFNGFDFAKIKDVIKSTVSKMSSARDHISKIAILFEGFLEIFP